MVDSMEFCRLCLPSSRFEEIMMTNHYPMDRRAFLLAGGLGFFGLNLANAAAYGAGDGPRTRRRTAKSTIMIWLGGGASHIDTWRAVVQAIVDHDIDAAEYMMKKHIQNGLQETLRELAGQEKRPKRKPKTESPT